MIKALNKGSIVVTPFSTQRDEHLSNVTNEDIVLTEADEGVTMEYADYGNGSGFPVINTDCLIALEQQENNRLSVRRGEKRKGIFNPDNEPRNPDGTFQRVVYSQIRTMFYHGSDDPAKNFGLEHIDFPSSRTQKFLQNSLFVVDVPHRIMGEKIQPGTVQLVDGTSDDEATISDDGHNNLYASRDIFWKKQEVGRFNNEFATGSFNNCSAYFDFSVPDAPVSLSVSSGSAVLNWQFTASSPTRQLAGFVVERSFIDESNYSVLSYATSGSIGSFVDANPPQGLVFYRVYAFNTFGNSNAASASIDFTVPELSAYESLLLWLDASTLTGSLSNSSSVASWDDRSPYNRLVTAVQSAPSQSLLLQSDDQISKPTVKFKAGWLSVQNMGSSSVSASELFMVVRQDNDPSPSAFPRIQGPLSIQREGLGGGHALSYIDSMSYEPYASSISPNIHTMITHSNNFSTSYAIWNVLAEDEHKAIRLNNEVIYSRDTDKHDFGSGSHFIGRSSGDSQWEGRIAELAIYKKILTPSERQDTVNYLANKYGLNAVNDSSSFNPLSIGRGIPEFWYDASALTASHSSSGQFVHSLPDLSGHNRHATNSLSATAPTYVSGYYREGVMPTLNFVSGSSLAIPETINIQAEQGFTFFAVVESAETDVNVISKHNLNVQFRIRNQTSSFYDNSSEAMGRFNPTGSFHSGSLQMYVWRRDAGAAGKLDTWINGGKVRTTTGAPAAINLNRIGFQPEDVPFVGRMCDLAFWTSSLSDQEVYKLYELYFRPKWSLPNGGHVEEGN